MIKINIIVNSAGKIVGTARTAIDRKGIKANVPDIKVGIVPSPCQSVHEVEVTEELSQLE